MTAGRVTVLVYDSIAAGSASAGTDGVAALSVTVNDAAVLAAPLSSHVFATGLRRLKRIFLASSWSNRVPS